MAEQEKPKVIFDDKEYEVDSLSAEAKYLVDLLGSLQSKERNIFMELDQIKAAQENLTAKFKEQVAKDAE